MTINISTNTRSSLMIFHHTQESETGYMLQVPGAPPVFISEKEADKLARYMLFENKDDSKAELFSD